MCLIGSHETARPGKLQLQSKMELVRVLAQPLIVLQEVIVLLGVGGNQRLQVVLDNVCTKVAHGLAWLDVAPSPAILGAKWVTT